MESTEGTRRRARTPLLLVLIVAGAAVGIAGEPPAPTFDAVPAPSWRAEAPRNADEIVARADHPDAASWACLDGDGGRRDTLVRLSALLESGRTTRTTVLEARAAARIAGEPLLAALEEAVAQQLRAIGDLGDDPPRPAWLPPAVDPVGPALERPEREAWAAWAATLPRESACTDAGVVGDRSAAAAVAALTSDGAAAAARARLDTILREARASAAVADTAGRPLANRAAELERALGALDDAEAAWWPTREAITELLGGLTAARGLEDAAAAMAIQGVRARIAGSAAPAAPAADRVLAGTARRLAVRAALDAPGLVVEHRTVLDLEHTPDGSPRRAAVAALIDAVEDQLHPLERLHAARVDRESAFEAAVAADHTATRDALDRRCAEQWWRLARAARILAEPEPAGWRRAWAWTEVGIARDRLLVLEGALTELERRAAWDAVDDAGFAAAAAEVDRLRGEIAGLREAEHEPLDALRRDAGTLLATAAEAAAELAGLAASTRPTVGDADARAFLAAVEAALEARAADLEETAALVGELRGALPPGVEPPAATFESTAVALIGVPDLERQVAARGDAVGALLDLGRTGTLASRDAALLGIAALLDLPAAVSMSAEAITIGIGEGAATAAIRVPTASAAPASTTSSRIDGPAAAVLSWEGAARPLPSRWLAERASAAPPPDDFHLLGSRTPPGWEAAQRDAQGDLLGTWAGSVGSQASSSLPSYGLGIGIAAVGLVFPPALAVGLGAIGITAVKDVVTGTAKGVNAAYGSADPRDRAWVDRGIDITRWTVDMVMIPFSISSATHGSAIVGDLLSAASGTATAPTSSSPNSPPDPYLARVAKADALIDAAFAAAKACRWPAARDQIYEAAAVDPYKQSTRWTTIGNRVLELCQEQQRYGTDAAAVVAEALERARREVYDCGPDAGTLPGHIKESYKDYARWSCDQTFDGEIRSLQQLAAGLARIRGVLRAAEASCDPAEARGLAQEVVTWAGGAGRRFSCADLLRVSAEDVIEWASRSGDDPVERLGRARRAIDLCRLDEARNLLAAPAQPDRCTDASLAAVVAETRAELWDRIEARERDDARLDAFGADVDAAVADCDRTRLEALLLELEGLEPCAEGSGSRRDALTARLRREIELASGDPFELIGEARDAFNEAIRLADAGCDMAPARIELERARSILFTLTTSPCGALVGPEVEELVVHGAYVEEQVDARDAVLARIRADFEAGDAAFTAALASCSRDGLWAAADLLGNAVAGIDAVPVMADPSCDALVALAGEAARAKDEATTLVGYWDAISTDLEAARRAATEGRRTAIDVYCAGVRQKAQPASCFAAELAECDGLAPGTPPTPPATTGTTVVPPPSPSPVPSGGGGGSGRVQIDDPEPCARDMSWSPARQQFECTCPGYRFDDALDRCVAGGATVAAVTQATCDAQYPGTELKTDPETGQPACLCPAGTAWSGSHGRCLDLAIAGGGPATRTACTAIPGQFFNTRTGRCDCLVGALIDGRCVDTGAAARQRGVETQQRAAECERLYSEIQVFRRNPDALYRQMAARAEAEARRLGCDAGRIDQAVARGDRPPLGSGGGPGGARGGGSGAGPGGGDGNECSIVSGSVRSGINLVFEKTQTDGDITVWVTAGVHEIGVDRHIADQQRMGNRYVGRYATHADAMGVATNACKGLPIRHNRPRGSPDVEGGGTCQVHEMGGEGDWVLAYRQDAQGNHINLYVFTIPGDEVQTVRAAWDARPGFRNIASTSNYQSAIRTAEHECIGRKRIR